MKKTTAHQIFFRHQLIAVFISCFLFIQCSAIEGTLSTAGNSNNGNTNSDEGNSQEQSGNNNSNPTQFDSEIAGNLVSEIDLNDGSGDIDLAAGDEAVLMVVSHSPYSNAAGFQVSPSENVDESFSFVEEHDHDHDILENEDAHEILRFAESQFIGQDLAERPATESTALASINGAPSQKAFKVISSFSNTSQYNEVIGINIYNGQNINAYMDSNDYDSLSDNDINAIVDTFEEFDLRIAPKEHQMFGRPSDIDKNGVVDVLVTRRVNNFFNSVRAFVTGYFYGGDLFPESSNPSSNEGEVIFLLAPDQNGSHGSVVSNTIYFENILPGVVAHEYQHAINYNEKINVADTSAEAPWLNEILSHLAEDLWNDMEETGIENLSRIQTYLSNPQNISLTTGTSLSERGGGYLMMRYLFERAEDGYFPNVVDGYDMVRGLLTNSLTGLDNIKDVLFGNSNDDEAWADVVSNFGLAVYFSNTNQINDSLYEFEGLNLRAIQEDNRGSFFNGPALMSLGSSTLTGALKGTSIAYIQINGESLQDLTLTIQNSENFSAYLIQ